MSQHAATARERAQQTASSRTFRPRTFNRRTQGRFLASRRGYWLSQVPGEPTPRQETLAETIAALEWAAEAARHENTLTSLRDLREHLRLRDRAVADLERTVKNAAEADAPVDPLAALHAHLDQVRREREDAEAAA